MMEAALATKPEEKKKTSQAAPESSSSSIFSPEEETGVAAGMPLFLQQSSLSYREDLVSPDQSLETLQPTEERLEEGPLDITTSADAGTSKAQTQSEKSAAGPTRAEPSSGGAKAEVAKPTAMPSPREALAPAITAVRHRAAGARKHRPPKTPVGSAQTAAKNPKIEKTRSIAEATVDNLNSATKGTGEVKREDFKDKLKKAIRDAMKVPQSESEAKRVMKTGAKDASHALHGQLATQSDAAVGPLKSVAKTEIPPTTPEPLPKAELQLEQMGSPPARVSAGPVVPVPLPSERLDYSSDRAPTDQIMAENDVSKEQLEEGNEPDFGPSLESRATAEKHEASAEARFRQSESTEQDKAKGTAQQALEGGLGGMYGNRLSRIGQVILQQVATKGKDASERQRVTNTIDGIKDKTKLDVTSILNEMETEVIDLFEAGLKRAEEAYEDTFEEAKGGWGTWLTTWGSDWEKHIEKSLDTARGKYLVEVEKAIDAVADRVETKLKQAKDRVTLGRMEVENFVDGLKGSVKKIGDEALLAVSEDFDAMGTEINQRRDGLINKLTQQYKTSYKRMSAMEEKLRSENKSLWQRVYDATVGLVKKIIAFKNMLLGVLGRAAAVIGDIIAHPIRFLGNLVSGVMLGLKNFMAKIGFYLKKGLMEWLFGALGGAGLKLPDKFDLKGIISIILQILGLTYANFRARAVGLLGEKVVATLEKTAEIFKIVTTEGVSGLWRFIKEKVSDIKSMVLDGIFDFIKERVIMAGIKWIIGLLNPVAAFFKACKAIYDIVMFFINRGSQILALVRAIVDSIAAIAKGAISAAATLVEGALAKAIPVAIGFLASLLGLGDPSKPVKETIEKARSPVNKVIDWVIRKAAKTVKAVGGALGFGKSPEEKEAARVTGFDGQIGETVEYDVEGEHHKIFIVTDGENSMLMVASQVVSAKELLKKYKKMDKDTNNNKAKGEIEAAGIVAENIDRIGDTLAKERRKRPPNEKESLRLDDALEVEERKFARQLAAIRKDLGESSGYKQGTEDNPILLDWPKPAIDDEKAYPVLYLNKDEDTLSLSGPATKKRTYKADIPKLLPNGTEIGVYTQYQAKKNLIFLVNKVGKTKRGGKLKTALKKYNFTPSAQRMDGDSLDGDHVMETQLGGPNELYNLWPLKSKMNSKGGRDLYLMTFPDLSEDPQKNLVSMKDLKTTINNGHPLWFQIRDTL